MVQLLHPYMTTGKTIALTRWTFVGKVRSLLFNVLSGLVIVFLPRSKHLLISWLQSPPVVILELKKIFEIAQLESHHLMANRWGNSGNGDRLFSWAPKSLQVVTAAMKLRDTCSLEEKL